MRSRCWRWWVSSCHPLILLVVANSFHCASSCEMPVSLPSDCHTLAAARPRCLSAHTLVLALLIQGRKWTVTHVWLLKVAAGFRDNTSTGWVWSNGQARLFHVTLFFPPLALSPFWIFEGGNSDGGRFTEWQCDRCSSIFPGWMCEWCSQRGSESGEQPSSSHGGTESSFSCSLQLQPFLFFY